MGLIVLGAFAGIAFRVALAWLNVTHVEPYFCFDWQPLGFFGVAAVVAVGLAGADSEWGEKPIALWCMTLAAFVFASLVLSYTANTPCSPL
jgi:hypothetical protein